MAVLVGLLLVVFCIGVALYPFLKVRSSGRVDNSAPVREILERRRAIYADLETLELERGLGNVDEVEYKERSREFRLAAAATFRDQESLERADEDIEEAISKELTRWKAAQQDVAPPDLCAACGEPLGDKGEEQCNNCGQRVEAS